jgi:hypothetical protein
MTSAELLEMVDRAIDRAVRQVLADDFVLNAFRHTRLRHLIRVELHQLERNLLDNGAGEYRFDADNLLRGWRPPEQRVSGGRPRR